MLDTNWVQVWTNDISSAYASPQHHYKVGSDNERTILAWRKFFYHENVDWAKIQAGEEMTSEMFINCETRQSAPKSLFAQTRDGKLLNYTVFPNEYVINYMRNAEDMDKSFVDYACALYGW